MTIETPDPIPWGKTLDAIGPTDKVRVSISGGEVLLQVRTSMGSATAGLSPNMALDIAHELQEGVRRITK